MLKKMTPLLTPMQTLNDTGIKRRTVLAGIAALAFAGPAAALTNAGASKLINNLVGEINAVINSGVSERAMINKFEKILVRYADVPIIARSALGPAARSASAGDMAKFTKAFQGYIARKYGKRFREFVGGDIKVKSTTDRGKFHQVATTVKLRNSSPFEVAFRVSDRSGKDLFFDMIIEGISLLSSERAEIGALLDRRGGSISRMTADLKKLG